MRLTFLKRVYFAGVVKQKSFIIFLVCKGSKVLIVSFLLQPALNMKSPIQFLRKEAQTEADIFT